VRQLLRGSEGVEGESWRAGAVGDRQHDRPASRRWEDEGRLAP
jgi:hypothetical protein